MNIDKFLNILTIVTIAIMIIFAGIMIISTIGMYIDHQCYQLEPNENYTSTICERYWK